MLNLIDLNTMSSAELFAREEAYLTLMMAGCQIPATLVRSLSPVLAPAPKPRADTQISEGRVFYGERTQGTGHEPQPAISAEHHHNVQLEHKKTPATKKRRGRPPKENKAKVTKLKKKPVVKLADQLVPHDSMISGDVVAGGHAALPAHPFDSRLELSTEDQFLTQFYGTQATTGQSSSRFAVQGMQSEYGFLNFNDVYGNGPQ